jgi:hypothetical protein
VSPYPSIDHEVLHACSCSCSSGSCPLRARRVRWRGSAAIGGDEAGRQQPWRQRRAAGSRRHGGAVDEHKFLGAAVQLHLRAQLRRRVPSDSSRSRCRPLATSSSRLAASSQPGSQPPAGNASAGLLPRFPRYNRHFVCSFESAQ